MPDAIKPDQIPGKDIDIEAIETNAASIRTIAASVRDNGAAVHTKWQGMAAVYIAPESDTLLGLMAPVNSQATTAGDNLDVVASALSQFAADVAPIKAELDSLRRQAQWFVDNTVANGVQVRELNPAWVSANGYYGSYAYATTPADAADIPQYRSVHKEWHEDQGAVDRNNELIAAVNAQMVLLWEAERTAANKIRALYGAAPLHSFQSEDDANGYGLDEIPEGTEMPWGAEVERSEGCGEATVNFVLKDFLWEGIVVGGIWGTVEGLGTLVLGYNPATGEWFSGEAYGAAWGNLGLLAAGLAIRSTPGLNLLIAADDIAQQNGGGFLPDEVREFTQSADEALLNTGKAIIAWDKWADDPGTALGESVFNVGTILIPAGAAVAGVKTAGTAANVLSKMARIADLIDPGAWAVNGALRVGGLGLDGLKSVIGSLDLSAVDDIALGGVDVSRAADVSSALDGLLDDGVPLDQITVRVDDGIPVLEAPGVRVELPEGAFDLPGGRGPEVTAPVREPELVGAGGSTPHVPHVVDSIVDEAPPVRTETGGSGEPTVVREPETTTGGSDAGGHGADQPGHGGSGNAGGDGPADGGGHDVDTAHPNADGNGMSPDRVYSMMDGFDHAATFAPEQLGPSRVSDSLLSSNGVTRAEFIDLINRPISSLSAGERSIVNSIRDSLTAQLTPDTVFQKVLDQPHFAVQADGSVTLEFGQGENIVLRDTTVISGSVSVADDTAHLGTPRDFFEALRLDYPHTNFAADDGSAYVLRFQADPSVRPDAIRPQMHSSMGGDGSVDHYSPPFTGNGFLKADDILPEYRADRVRMGDGAEIWEVLDDGTQRLYAVLRGGEWIPQGN